MSLWTLNEVHSSTFKVKQSDFISYIRKINSISEFRSWLSQLKKDHYDSNHACWAYRIYENRQLNTHFSDAGEPSGTAGRTIMRVLKQFEIVQGSIVVERYFGVLSKYIYEKKYKIIQDRSNEKLKWTIQIDERKASEFIKMFGLLTLGEGQFEKSLKMHE